ncbi:MAG: hypothetical protein WBZ36_20995 [Candidatus Nitrosopolaris sp.]|jgi:hypothetical protein
MELKVRDTSGIPKHTPPRFNHAFSATSNSRYVNDPSNSLLISTDAYIGKKKKYIMSKWQINIAKAYIQVTISHILQEKWYLQY